MAVSVMVPVYKKKVLILRRGPTAPWMPGAWNFPGGVVDPGESPHDAAVRECEEEAGLTVSGIKSLGSFPQDGYTIHAFTGLSPTGKIVLRPTHGIMENDGWTWIDETMVDRFRWATPVLAKIVSLALRANNGEEKDTGVPAA